MVYYLKYRPKTIDELDLKSVRTRLASILSSDNIPHAFLFSGPRGLGKTSSARILAREVHGKKLDSDTIAQISQGSHPDVLEIDAASNRGIDEIRELRARVKYVPMVLPKKVYIIDEVHMLTREAFNALLKTLEEPPSHVIFVLATTEPWKLPETIISRVFHVQFEEPTSEEIVASLERIVEGEQLEVEDGVLLGIVELADGAFRDAAKILEELSLAAGGKKITNALVEEVYKTSSVTGAIDDLLAALATRDMQTGLDVVERIDSTGVDMGVVVTRVLERLHHGLTSGTSEFSHEEILRLVELFTTCYQQLKVTPVPQLPMQMVVVGWNIYMKNNKDDLKNIGRVDKAQKGSKLHSVNKKNGKTTDSHMPQSDNKSDLLKQLISAIDQENRMLAGVLRGVTTGRETDGEIEFLTKSTFHKEKMEERKSMELIQKKISDITGKEKEITVTMVSD